MIRWAEVPVYLHRAPVDFRKSINGLAQVVEQGMGRSPMERALFVFGAKSRDRIKVLYCKRQSNPTLPECATGSYLPAFGRGLRWGVGVRRLGRSCSRRRLVAG